MHCIQPGSTISLRLKQVHCTTVLLHMVKIGIQQRHYINILTNGEYIQGGWEKITGHYLKRFLKQMTDTNNPLSISLSLSPSLLPFALLFHNVCLKQHTRISYSQPLHQFYPIHDTYWRGELELSWWPLVCNYKYKFLVLLTDHCNTLRRY